MRRKPGALFPLECAILETGLLLRGRGSAEFHGFLLARELQQLTGAPRIAGYGTLYKALWRLEQAGLLVSRWEAPELAERERRPRRRLYAVTPEGAVALAHGRTAVVPAGGPGRPLPGGATA